MRTNAKYHAVMSAITYIFLRIRYLLVTESSVFTLEKLVYFYRAPVAQLVEHRAVTREVVSSTPAGPSLRVSK